MLSAFNASVISPEAFNFELCYTDPNVPPFSETFDGETLEYIKIPNLGYLEDYEGIDVEGKIAVVSRGVLTFVEKVNNAYANGAIAVVLYNNESGYITIGIDGALIPAISVSQEDGGKLGESGTMSFEKDYNLITPSDSKGAISTFSSRGTTPELKIKPEITAPGGNIYSTYPISMGSYMTASGTSMAAPHVAGAGVLMKQYVNDKFDNLTGYEKSILIENLLASSAQIIIDKNVTDEPTPYSVQSQGAGMMDIGAAINADVVLYDAVSKKTKIELGDRLNPNKININFEAENITDSEVTYDINGILMVDDFVGYGIEGLEKPLFFNNDLKSLVLTDAAFGNVTLAPKSKESISVSFSIDLDDDEILKYVNENGYIVDGFITLTPPATKEGVHGVELSIPFLGFVGDWLDAPVFDHLSIYQTPETTSELSFYAGNAALGVDSLEADTDEYGNVIRELKSFYEDFGKVLQLSEYDVGLVWDGYDDDGNLVPEGKYTYTLIGTLDYDEPISRTREHEWSIDVTIDNTLPEFKTDVQPDTVNLTVSDNEYLQYIMITDDLNDESNIIESRCYYGEDSDSFTVSMEEWIAKYGDLEEAMNNIYVYAIDYAGNNTYKTLRECDESPYPVSKPGDSPFGDISGKDGLGIEDALIILEMIDFGVTLEDTKGKFRQWQVEEACKIGFDEGSGSKKVTVYNVLSLINMLLGDNNS